ncbi:restriction endonuclease subunit S [Stenotrophomonas maltophilia]|uniref:restriction endonuclease subunit S n=1 Tax=Stenotrophomonas maltophilia TaxID=40324 RepID=UPI002553FAFD|nr:restriction endonuclease subunit S [Stenotrophomonas maltophilia]HEL5572037.1 restriction endonuclease subunit S [Stenotrophomonas maltophilia]
MKISDIFDIFVARSHATDEYSNGNIPFVTNSEINNGIVRYVDPIDDDLTFPGGSICVSGLGHATVHFDEFLPKGNGGDSCTILVPKDDLSKADLLYYAAMFNVSHGWRFSFGRKASRRRIELLEIDAVGDQSLIDVDVSVAEVNDKVSGVLTKKEGELVSKQ